MILGYKIDEMIHVSSWNEKPTTPSGEGAGSVAQITFSYDSLQSVGTCIPT